MNNDAIIADVGRQYAAELEAVRDYLYASGAALDMPLRSLVQAQIRQSQPEIRAAVVLACAVNDLETERLRTQRIQLAAALEMLYVALNVHKLLLQEDIEPTDKSLLGGTILAGDYCFSQSANMAVQTDNAAVVDIFSQALKETSEGNLRHLFDHESAPFSENQTLCRRGAEASLALIMSTDSSADTSAASNGQDFHNEEMLALVAAIVAQFENQQFLQAELAGALENLASTHRARFDCLLSWLQNKRST